MAHIYNGILLSHKKKFELFIVRWMDLESLIKSEVSQREKQIPYANTYIWNIRKNKKGHEEPRGKTGIKMETY